MTARFARVPARAAGLHGLGERDLRVLIAIATCADGSGRAFPSMAWISAATGIGRSDIPRIVRHLEQFGLISRKRRVDAAGDFASTIYRVHYDGELSAQEQTGGVSAGADTVSAQEQTGCQRGSPGGVSAGADVTNNNRPTNRHTPRKRAEGCEIHSVAQFQFEEFWRTYPSRGGHTNPKKPARDKFLAAVDRGVDPKLLIRAAGNYDEFIRRTGTAGRFVKQALYWLSQECWQQYAEAAEPEPLRAGMI